MSNLRLKMSKYHPFCPTEERLKESIHERKRGTTTTRNLLNLPFKVGVHLISINVIYYKIPI